MPKLKLAPQPRERRDIIVVGSDLTDSSDAAVIYALQLARALAAHVGVIHIAQHIELKKGRQKPLLRNDLLALQRVLESQRADAEQKLARQLRRIKAQSGEAALEVRLGSPSKDLLVAAQKKRAVLLVLGSAVQGAGIGHVAQSVLKGSRVPVVVVPAAYSSGSRRGSASRVKLHLVPKPSVRREPVATSGKVGSPSSAQPTTPDERLKRRAVERWENEGGRAGLPAKPDRSRPGK